HIFKGCQESDQQYQEVEILPLNPVESGGFTTQAGVNGHFSRGSPTCTTSFRISGAPSMPVSVAWKWKADAYPPQTGCLICRSSPRAAFDERCHAPPHNSVECGTSRWAAALLTDGVSLLQTIQYL